MKEEADGKERKIEVEKRQETCTEKNRVKEGGRKRVKRRGE
jgi:hypothetical protein